MRGLSAIVGLALAGVAAAQARPPPMAEAEEVRLALEAAPEHLRAGAGVYLLEQRGYRLVRPSRNGFRCLIERDVAAFEPKCFDVEGSDTLLPVILFRAERRAQGTPDHDIERSVAARFASGEFVAPRRVGICYMLSERNVIVTDRAARSVARVGPRLMFYAPYLRSSDVGASADLESRMLMAQEGSESAMIVVPVISAQRTRTFYLSPDALSPLTRAPVSAGTESPRRDSLDASLRKKCGAGGCRIESPPRREISPTP